jgi:hypothetical protein
MRIIVILFGFYTYHFFLYYEFFPSTSRRVLFEGLKSGTVWGMKEGPLELGDQSDSAGSAGYIHTCIHLAISSDLLGRHAGRQARRHAGTQARRQARRQAGTEAGKRSSACLWAFLCLPVSIFSTSRAHHHLNYLESRTQERSRGSQAPYNCSHITHSAFQAAKQ